MTEVQQEMDLRPKYSLGISKIHKKNLDAYGKKNVTILPPMHLEETNHSRAGSEASSYGGKKNQNISNIQLEAAEATVDRLRVTLREKEIEIGKLRHENSTIKQRERRNQRDIEQLEQSNLEAPKMIARLREELSIAKNKLKQYYTQIGDDSRVIRQLHDERNRLKEQNAKLQSLVDSQNLDERDQLTKKIEDQNKKISDLQRLVQETEINFEMVERNLSIDNRNLRGKIHFLDQEKVLFQEQIVKLQEVNREKEKVIASLSIYRYNAIHRKQEVGCKVCFRREKDEQEQRRQKEIIDRLPLVEIQSITAKDSSACTIRLNEFEINEKILSHVMVTYSDDPMMEVGIFKKIFNVENQSIMDLIVDKLLSGTKYYFNVSAGFEKVFGVASNTVSILVDQLPEAPEILSVQTSVSPPSIQLLFSPANTSGSEIESYRLYHSQSADFSEYYLALTESVEKIPIFDGNYLFSLNEPQMAVSYYFKIAAVNRMGEGKLSTMSSEIIVDIPPGSPEKPIVKKLTANSLKITAINPKTIGSLPSRFKLTMCRINEDGTNTLEDILIYQVVSMHKNYEFHHTINNVGRGISYKFQLIACNAHGDSDASEWSDIVNSDLLVPALEKLRIASFSAQNFTVTAPSRKNIEKPVIKGFRVRWSLDKNFNEFEGETGILLCDSGTHVISVSNYGGTYYVCAYFVGEFEEGEPCPTIFIPLASSIPLPTTPDQNSNPMEPISYSSDSIDEAYLLQKQSSTSSNLSINQRITNMHHGAPAYQDPPILLETRNSSESLVGKKAIKTKQKKNDTKIGLGGSTTSLHRSVSFSQMGQKSYRKV